MCSYNFHWYLTPGEYSSGERLNWSREHKRVEWILFLFSGLATTYYFLFLHRYAGWIAIGAFLTFLYTAPKIPWRPLQTLQKIAVGKTLFLTAVWTYITTILPVVISGGPFGPAVLLITLHRFFLIYAVCIMFDFRDQKRDRLQGIRSLVTRLSEKGNDRLFYTVCALAIIVTTALCFFGYSAAIVAALCCPVVLGGLLYPVSKRSHSDYLYYFVIDGLVALSAGLTVFL